MTYNHMKNPILHSANSLNAVKQFNNVKLTFLSMATKGTTYILQIMHLLNY